MRERSFDFLELLNMTIWALPPLVLIPRDFFPWIEMWASSKRAGRGAQQLKPLCCSEGNVVLVVCIRQQLCCHFPPFVVLAPLEGRCVDVGLDSSSRLWDADFGCTWEDTKAGGCCWTHQARWWLAPQRGFQVSGLQLSRTCFIQDLPHYNLLYPDLHHLIILFVHLGWTALVNRALTGQASIVSFNLGNFQPGKGLPREVWSLHPCSRNHWTWHSELWAEWHSGDQAQLGLDDLQP